PEPIPLSLNAAPSVRRDLAAAAASAAAAAEPPAELLRAVGRYALARVDGGRQTLQVHRLVQAVIRAEMSDSEREEAAHLVHRALAESRPQFGDVDDPAAWAALEQLWPHLSASDAHACDDPATRQLLVDRVRYLRRRGDLERADALGRWLDTFWTGRHRADEGQILLLRFERANVARAQGKYAVALALDEDTLDRQKSRLGEDHPATLRTAGSLSADRRALGSFTDALQLDRDILGRLNASLGRDHPQTLAVANNLAIDHRLIGDSAAARDLDRDTAARRLAVLGPQHPYTLTSRFCLARDLRELGEHAPSCAILRETVATCEQVLEPDDLTALRAADSLAVSLRRLGHEEESGRLARQTYDRYLARYGPGAADALVCTLNLAAVHSAEHDHDTACELADRAHQGHARLFGDRHPLTS
ncbi:FxSxx-COOH system tetratricopeptide repeat protein, partial [Kitasatospora sp. NPDC093558]|uniref:FxSxx-COOH system tetratricopeptide repeat protein n=1 Tax=Kitasatospora sp. NPDC093558 TaxID=3155201 RepID=UPI00342B736A